MAAKKRKTKKTTARKTTARKTTTRKKGKRRKAAAAAPAFKATMTGEGGKQFGCYTKRVKKRGGGTRVAGYCRLKDAA